MCLEEGMWIVMASSSFDRVSMFPGIEGHLFPARNRVLPLLSAGVTGSFCQAKPGQGNSITQNNEQCDPGQRSCHHNG